MPHIVRAYYVVVDRGLFSRGVAFVLLLRLPEAF